MQDLMMRLSQELKHAKTEAEQQEIIAKYAKLSVIQQIAYGSVYTVEDMIKHVESKQLTPRLGYAYYWDNKNKEETDVKMSFNVKKIKAKANKYEYVIWHYK